MFGRVNLYIIVIDFIDYFMRRFFFLFDREEELRWTLQYK